MVAAASAEAEVLQEVEAEVHHVVVEEVSRTRRPEAHCVPQFAWFSRREEEQCLLTVCRLW